MTGEQESGRRWHLPSLGSIIKVLRQRDRQIDTEGLGVEDRQIYRLIDTEGLGVEDRQRDWDREGLVVEDKETQRGLGQRTEIQTGIDTEGLQYMSDVTFAGAPHYLFISAHRLYHTAIHKQRKQLGSFKYLLELTQIQHYNINLLVYTDTINKGDPSPWQSQQRKEPLNDQAIP